MNWRFRARWAPSRGAWAASIALAAALLGSPSALAQSPVERAAEELDGDDPVYVAPGSRPTLSPREAGRLRFRIARQRPGRIRVAVLPAAAAADGGVGALANRIDRQLRARGTLIVVAGSGIHAVVSYPNAEGAVRAIRRAVAAHPRGPLAAQLLDAINGIARVDPGPSGDARERSSGGDGSGTDDLSDSVAGVFDAARLLLLALAAAILLPFLWLGARALLRYRRGRAGDERRLERQRELADEQLVDLGDGIRGLDIDVSMPGADPAGRAAYERALAAHERACAQLNDRDVAAEDIASARETLAEGTRAIEEARRLLEGARGPRAGGTPGPPGD